MGFGDVAEGLAPELAHLSTAISLSIRHPVGAYPYARVRGRVYDPFSWAGALLEEIQGKVVNWLRSAGWRALAIPPDTHRPDRRFVARLYPLFSHKTAATCAGLGWVGKSGLLVIPGFGPAASWATVLTNAPLETAEPFLAGCCGSCRRCVDACPAGAIKGKEWKRGMPIGALLDLEACRSHLQGVRSAAGGLWCGACLEACSRDGNRP